MAMQCGNVFVYGTLQAEEVLKVLIKRVPRSSGALLPDYHRYSLLNREYPAATYMTGDQIKGKLLIDLTEEELQILDSFEGDEYTKQIVEPLLFLAIDKGYEQKSSTNAFVYVWTNPKDTDLFGTWNYEEWRSQKLDEYIELCEEFIATGVFPE